MIMDRRQFTSVLLGTVPLLTVGAALGNEPKLPTGQVRLGTMLTPKDLGVVFKYGNGAPLDPDWLTYTILPRGEKAVRHSIIWGWPDVPKDLEGCQTRPWLVKEAPGSYYLSHLPKGRSILGRYPNGEPVRFQELEVGLYTMRFDYRVDGFPKESAYYDFEIVA